MVIDCGVLLAAPATAQDKNLIAAMAANAMKLINFDAAILKAVTGTNSSELGPICKSGGIIRAKSSAISMLEKSYWCQKST
jgi:hypothetical protein